MGVEYQYNTTIDKLISDLQELKKKHGGKTSVILSNPGFYDPNFEGRNSKLTAEFRDKLGLQKDVVVICEKGIK